MTSRAFIPNRVSIDEFPALVDGQRIGDWEMDTIVGKERFGVTGKNDNYRQWE